MPIEYRNRREECFTLYEGRTKTGKPKYYCSRKESLSGTPADAMPEGYEFYERPADATVSVRRIRPSRITDAEKDLVADGIRKLADRSTFIIDTQGDHLIVYLPDRDPGSVAQFFGGLVDRATAAGMSDWAARNCAYSAHFRLTLVEDRLRLFEIERWCSRGSSDHWILLARAAPLDQLVTTFMPHLGKASYFELF